MQVLIAILFSIAVVSAIPAGWQQPSAPVLDLEMAGAVALAGEGAASAGQAVSETASGNAELLSINGVDAVLLQNGDVIQIADADLSGDKPSTLTIQGVSGSNQAFADDYLVAQITADNIVSVENSAGSSVDGSAALAATGETTNTVIAKKN